MINKITIIDAYSAMIKFLEKYQEGSDDIAALLGSMDIALDGETRDPAVWKDWINAVDQALKEAICYPDKHVENLKKILEIDSNNTKILTELGAIDLIFHKNESSIDYLRRAINADPKNLEAYFWLAHCLFYKYGKDEEVLELIQWALKQDPNRADFLSLFAEISINNAKEIPKAIDYIKKAIAIQPYWFNLRRNLITLYMKQDKNDLILQELKKTLLFIESIEEPKNIVDAYYERVVTGRYSKNNENEKYVKIWLDEYSK